MLFFSLVGFLTACTPSSFSSQQDHYSRGSYRGSYYIVQEGDTLYYIAYITDRDINEIIAANTILNPNKIYSGQKLNLWHSKYIAPAYGTKQTAKLSNSHIASNNQTASSADASLISKSNAKQTSNDNDVTVNENAKGNRPWRKDSDECIRHYGSQLNNCNENLIWKWPTDGRIVSDFSNAEFGNKGIDIEGLKGQDVKASADGKVVYAGSALRGYGNLIIIKHNKNYLSAYAHNDSLLVKERQRVRQGQKIATMGSSGTDTVRLHFEIRYKGRSVNPSQYLPDI